MTRYDPKVYDPAKLVGEDAATIDGFTLCGQSVLDWLDEMSEHGGMSDCVPMFDELYCQVARDIRHRIADDMLKGAPAIGDALDAFLDFIGEDAVLAGHNIASFDIPFMEAAAAKSGRDFTYLDVIDTLEAARELWPDLPSRSMDSLRGILGIERTDAHRALADCYDELAVLNAELSVIMQSYARKMDYCRGELLRIAGEIAEEIGE